MNYLVTEKSDRRVTIKKGAEPRVFNVGLAWFIPPASWLSSRGGREAIIGLTCGLFSY